MSPPKTDGEMPTTNEYNFNDVATLRKFIVGLLRYITPARIDYYSISYIVRMSVAQIQQEVFSYEETGTVGIWGVVEMRRFIDLLISSSLCNNDFNAVDTSGFIGATAPAPTQAEQASAFFEGPLAHRNAEDSLSYHEGEDDISTGNGNQFEQQQEEEIPQPKEQAHQPDESEQDLSINLERLQNLHI